LTYRATYFAYPRVNRSAIEQIGFVLPPVDGLALAFCCSGSGAGVSSVSSIVVGQATSATIIPSTAGGRRGANAPLGTFIPLQSPTAGQDDSMSLIVQLGTTVVTKGPGTSITNTGKFDSPRHVTLAVVTFFKWLGCTERHHH